MTEENYTIDGTEKAILFMKGLKVSNIRQVHIYAHMGKSCNFSKSALPILFKF